MAADAGLIGEAGMAIGAGRIGRCLILAVIGLAGIGRVLGLVFGVVIDSYGLTLGAIGTHS